MYYFIWNDEEHYNLFNKRTLLTVNKYLNFPPNRRRQGSHGSQGADTPEVLVGADVTKVMQKYRKVLYCALRRITK